MYRYAIVGFGGLGKKHLCNLKKIEEERGDFSLAAICGTTADKAKESVATNIGTADLSDIDFSLCNFYQDYKEMIDNEKLDFVLSVLPTYLHKEVAVYALSKGIHVFSEKPMALTLDDCEAMICAARENKRTLMIGQVLRFNQAWRQIKEYIKSNQFGKVCKASFERYSRTPLWTWNNWILEPEKSGGCVLDMHVHDVDMINWLFGMPKALRSYVTSNKVELESISTQYFYEDFVVEGRADWSLPQTFPFRALCRIDFEKASVVLDNNNLNIYTDDKCEMKSFTDENDFIEELRTFLKLALDGEDHSEITSAESVSNSVKIVVKELEAARKTETVFL